MKRFILFILLATIFAFSVAAQSSVVAKAQRITGDRFAFSATTPDGANVLAVKKPSRQMLDAIDMTLSVAS